MPSTAREHPLKTCACGRSGTRHFVGDRCAACYQRSKPKEARREANKRWYRTNPDKVKAMRPSTAAGSTVSWVRRLRLLGLTSDDYLRMLEEQDHKCAICGAEDNGHFRVFCVDHDHTTGQVRGLLCAVCNKGIGTLGDSIELLEKALAYLRSHQR